MPKTGNVITKEIGYVVKSKEYIAYIEGLPTAKINDIVMGGNGERGIVSSLEENYVVVLILDKTKVRPGVTFYRKPDGIQLPLGTALLGRTISPLGDALDAKGDLPHGRTKLNTEVIASGISTRAEIFEQLKTGISMIDLLLPIGKGQKELIFGEPRSGKTTFLLDVIANQKNRNIICIYGALGKSEIDVKRLAQNLDTVGASSYSVIVAALASDPAPLIAITPTVAFAIADFFLANDHDVLLILDDLGTHAKYLREIALLSEQVPGRESYPSDIFHQHAHLIERAGNFKTKDGKTISLTLLPVMETNFENLTTLIPTNLISSTDGHLLFSSSLHSQGQYPPIEIERSVTRVGRQTQTTIAKVMSDKIRSLLAEYRDLLSFSRFGSEITYKTQLIIKRGQLATELLKQEPLEKVPTEHQVALFSLIFTRFLVDKDIEFLIGNKKKIIAGMKVTPEFKELMTNIPNLTIEQLIDQVNSLESVLIRLCQ